MNRCPKTAVALVKRRNRYAASVFALITVPLGAQPSVAPQRQTIESAGVERSYYLFVPESVTPSAPAPLLVLLHGSGQNGLGVLREWTELAVNEGFIVAAPNAFDSMYWQVRKDTPTFVRDVVDAVALSHPVDRRRVYLFGLSGGAVYALTLSVLESEYFAATAVFAGAWRDKESFAVIPLAKRKIPVSICVGDRDEFFPLKSVRATEEALKKEGHPVMVTILKRWGHSYSGVAPRVNRDAWDFMKAVELDVNPRFQSYDQS